MYKNILKFRVDGADSGFLPSVISTGSFLVGTTFGLVATLLFSIGTVELVSFAGEIFSEFDLSEGLIMSLSLLPTFSWAKETSGKRQKPRTATLKKVNFLKLNVSEYDIFDFNAAYRVTCLR